MDKMALAEELPSSKARLTEAKQASDRTRLQREVGANIRAYRKLKGFSLWQLAKACGTTAQTMQRLETDNMTVSLYWIQRITEELGIEPFMLFGGTSTIGRANEETRRVKAQLAAMHGAVRVLVAMVNEFAPEQDGDA